MFDFDDNCLEVIDYRLSKMRSTFYTLCKMLCDRTLPLKSRLEFLTSRVYPVFLCNTSACCISKAALEIIRVVDRSFLRKMIGLRRNASMTYVEFIKRSTKTAIRLSSRCRHVPLEQRWLRSTFDVTSKLVLASECSRSKLQRFAFDCLVHRDSL